MAGPGPGATVRRIRPEEWRELRAFRLRALAADPAAFGQRLAEAEAQDESTWRGLAETGAAGDARVTFVAEADGTWAGMVNAALQDDGHVEVTGLWSVPEARGRGIGLGLMEACRAWAREKKVPRIRLWVNAANDSARRLYERTGYVPLGEPRPGTRDPTRSYVRMGRDV